MIWLTSPEATAPRLPAAWLIRVAARPANLPERSALRRETARRTLAGQFGLTPELVAIEHDPRGRPFLAHPAGTGLHISLATRAGIVAVALAQRPIGIDVEGIDAVSEPPLTVLHREEREALQALRPAARPLAFAQIWSAKEAYVKALGTGLSRAPDSFAVTLLSADSFAVLDPARPGRASGVSRTIENGGQETLAAAVVVLA